MRDIDLTDEALPLYIPNVKEPLSNPTQQAESNSITTYQFIEESSVLFRNVALFELFVNLNILLGINIEVIADLI